MVDRLLDRLSHHLYVVDDRSAMRWLAGMMLASIALFTLAALLEED